MLNFRREIRDMTVDISERLGDAVYAPPPPLYAFIYQYLIVFRTIEPNDKRLYEMTHVITETNHRTLKV